jgi:hypothetical protein
MVLSCTLTHTFTALRIFKLIYHMNYIQICGLNFGKNASGRLKVISHEEILFYIHFVISVKPQIERK